MAANKIGRAMQQKDKPRTTYRQVSEDEAAQAAERIYERFRARDFTGLAKMPDTYAGIVDFVNAHPRDTDTQQRDDALLLTEFLRTRAARQLRAAELRQGATIQHMKDAGRGVHPWNTIAQILGLNSTSAAESRWKIQSSLDRPDVLVRTHSAVVAANREKTKKNAHTHHNITQLRHTAEWIAQERRRYISDDPDFAADCDDLAELTEGWPTGNVESAIVRAGRIRACLRPMIRGITIDPDTGARGNAMKPVDPHDIDAQKVLELANILV